MRDFLAELSALAVQPRPGVSQEALGSWEARAGRALPEEVKSLYVRFDGGAFPGGVEVLPFAEVAAQLPEAPVVLGRRGETSLVMTTRANFARQSPGVLPSWMEELAEDTWVFGLREGDAGTLRPARTFEGVLERVLPPRETESFGENTLARGMTAVAEVLASLKEPTRTVAPVAPKAKAKPKSKAKPKAKRPAKKKAVKRVAKARKPRSSKKKKAPARASKARRTATGKRR